MSEELRLEPARREHAPGVTEIVSSLEAALYGSSTYGQSDLEDEWAELDLAQDARVVCVGDRVAGYAAIRERGETFRVEAFVHPDVHGLGIGRLLVTELEEEAIRHGARRMTTNVFEADPRARRLMEKHGFSPVRVFREMRIELVAPPPAPELPDGLRVVPFDPDAHAVAFHAAHQEAFRDHFDHTPRDFASWSREHLRSERLDPDLWCVVRDGDDIAAGAIGTLGTYGAGWVHVLFTRRPWRRRGVGAALLGESFRRFWERGEHSVGLGVDAASATGAFRLYERAGMTPAIGWVMYEKELR